MARKATVPRRGTARPLRAAGVDALIRAIYRAAYRILRIWWRIARPRASGASVAVWDRGRLLVVRPSYRAVLDLPGGGMLRCEDPIEAAVRELREETAIRLDPSRLRPGTRLEFIQDARSITQWVFEAHIDEPPTVTPDGREIVEAGWVDPAELEGCVLSSALAGYLRWRGAGAHAARRPSAARLPGSFRDS